MAVLLASGHLVPLLRATGLSGRAVHRAARRARDRAAHEGRRVAPCHGLGGAAGQVPLNTGAIGKRSWREVGALATLGSIMVFFCLERNRLVLAQKPVNWSERRFPQTCSSSSSSQDPESAVRF